jgi:DNA-binding CsgD family transcriptional regulator
MAQQREGLVGRQDELAALRGDGRTPAMTVVRGVRGCGKTAVLAQFGRELRAGGVLTLSVACDAPQPEWDTFGVGRILGAIREQFELIGVHPRLPESIEMVGRLCTEETYRSPWLKFSMLTALGTLFARLGAAGRVVLLIDDVDQVPEPVPTLTAVHRAGLRVVASCTAGGMTGSDALDVLADQVIELGDLAEQDVEALLRRVANIPVDRTLRDVLRTSLGPLWGNPGTLLSTMADLRQRDRAVAVHGVLCLRDPGKPIALPAGHRMLASLAESGQAGSDLVLLAASAIGLSVDEIPLLVAATEGSSADYGRTVDQLVLSGALESSAAGRLSCVCPALGAAVTEQAGEDEIWWLHRAMAEQLLGTEGLYGGPLSILAGHAAAAGRSLPPRPALVGVLRDDGIRLRPFDRARRAANGYAAWWHAGPGAERSVLQSELLRLLVRTADYPRLAEFVADAVGEGPETASCAELAAAAALAAVHTGRPVSVVVSGALAGCAKAAGPLEFADRWFSGESLRFEQVAAAFAAAWPGLGNETERSEDAGVQIENSCEIRDLVPVFVALFGAEYGVPERGTLATYHRLCRGYADGDWLDALSAARELELDQDVDRYCREYSRLMAAEMSAWREEDRRAAAWLDQASEVDIVPALRAWVSLGMGDPAEAFESGWRAYQACAGPEADEPGMSRLLQRLVSIAGSPPQTEQVLAAIDAHHERVDSPRSLETALLGHGMAEADGARVRAAERLVRRRGEQMDLALVSELVGRICGDPDVWLREAFDISRNIGAAKLIAWAKRSMTKTGVVVPVTRSRSEDLSVVEVRIIELVRLGQTNRQIAQSVQMSEKTVEKHLTKLYLKAGCRNRYGLATSGLGGRRESVDA